MNQDSQIAPDKDMDLENRPVEGLDASGSPSFQLPAQAGRRSVLITDADGVVVSTDGNLDGVLGVSELQMIGRSIYEVAHDVLRSRFADSDTYESSWSHFRDDPFQTIEDVLELSIPEKRVIHRYSTPLFDSDGKIVGRTEIYSDITRRRELETTVRRAYQELRATQDQLVQSEKLRAVGEIASGVAHDFNNTLGIILGNIQLLIRSVNDESILPKLKSVELAAMDGIDTVKRIQNFTRTGVEGARTGLNLTELVSEVVEMMRPVWQDSVQTQGNKIDIVTDLNGSIPVAVNGPEIREVLANILLNGVQAMPDGGRVVVSSGRSEHSGWVRISDTGTGMTEDVRKRVFDPFFTTRGVSGTGLGMSVAYGIINRHGGRIAIESEPGKGTIVTVFLPISDEADHCVPDTPVESSPSTSARVLMVDDEEMFAEVFSEMLSELGHIVTTARSGIEAVEMFSEGDFDLVFTDLGMPDMSGWQVAEKIRAKSADVPIVLLTGWGAVISENEIEGMPVDVVLSKPVRFEELASVVSEALDKRKAGKS